MAIIRPNAEPAATSVAAGDIFLIDGATGVRALDATFVVIRDANGNVALDNIALGYTTTATAAGTTVLTATSTYAQYFTGATTQIITLPDVTTLKQGHSFYIQNSSSGALTVNSSGGNLVQTIAAGASALISCILITGTTAASWSSKYHAALVASGKVLTVSNTLTLAGTDGTTMTFPSTSATIARTDAANTFTGTQTVGALVATTVNGVGISGSGAAALALGANTLTINSTMALGGGVAGQISVWNAGNMSASSTPTLGASGTLGSVTFGNATSGLVTLQPVTGALGTVTLSLPAITDTLITKTSSDVLSNKTFNTASAGNVFAINSNVISSNTGTGAVNVLQAQPTINQANLVGTTTNDNAAAGSVGEYTETVIASGSAVSLVNNTAKTVTSVTLGAGDWDISGNISFTQAGTTSVTGVYSSLSLVTNTLDATPGRQSGSFFGAAVPGAGTSYAVPVGPHRFSLSGSTTIFLVAVSNFTVSTQTAFGIIRARRIR